ncbi:MAG TPA: hypothetical protein DD649_17535 [Providencia sp.]|uniref:hypothetical protein n=1 Tax=Providencia sp. TaxID=589 RepID=UPI000E959700|nr:hypothetical protein [Providencia sp.]MBP6083081.1 hypothetical protein [Providencia sp.]HBO24667.1 hypothetical protein [Providencia sp.]
MQMKLLKFISFFFSILLISCVSDERKDNLVYVFENEFFILKKECVSKINLTKSEVEEKLTMWITLKKNNFCSDRFNLLINSNVGGYMQLFFNEKILLDSTYIATEFDTSKSYAFSIKSKLIGFEILKAYNK